MYMKFAVIFTLAVVARGASLTTPYIAQPVPAIPLAVEAKLVDSQYDPNPQYTFAYDVQDTLTGDSKGQVESRNGNVVQGQYRVVDADGTLRTVDYTADPVNGFNAIVSKSPLVVASPAQISTPVVAAAAVPSRIVASPFIRQTSSLNYPLPGSAFVVSP